MNDATAINSGFNTDWMAYGIAIAIIVAGVGLAIYIFGKKVAARRQRVLYDGKPCECYSAAYWEPCSKTEKGLIKEDNNTFATIQEGKERIKEVLEEYGEKADSLFKLTCNNRVVLIGGKAREFKEGEIPVYDRGNDLLTFADFCIRAASIREDMEGTDNQVKNVLRSLADYLPKEVYDEALKLNDLTESDKE